MAVLLAVCAFTSCIYEDVPEPDVKPAVPGEHAFVRIGFQLPSGRAGEGSDGEYEQGVNYENYIGLSSGNIGIYLFGLDNKLIAKFVPMMVVPPEDNDQNSFRAVGEIPDKMQAMSGFKVVMMCNLPVDADEGIIPGTTTIDDLCSAEWTKFRCLKNPVLNPGEKRMIPLFGIREYSGITFKKGAVTELSEPVTLLRAMAKVEIVFDSETASLSDVAVRGFNSSGYSAPAGVYSQNDYDHNGQWDSDYVKTLHMPGGINDAGQGANTLPLYCKNRRTDTRKETWVCYVPEYRNTDNDDGTANYQSRIELKLSNKDANVDPYPIFFCDYNADGNPVAGTTFDIHRNDLYRFTVSLAQSGFVVNVKKWENAYDNNFRIE